MNIEGLDYNTKREKLVLPEYGREIQNMVNYALTLESEAERQQCAETIVSIMERMFPQGREGNGYKRKLWDHLAIISDFKLDIDYPYDVSKAGRIATKPDSMPYSMSHIPVRHYGKMVFDVLEKIKEMPDGEQRDELIRIAANQMKRDLLQWGRGSVDDEKVVSDLAKYTDGVVQLDLAKFKFEKSESRNNERKHRKR